MSTRTDKRLESIEGALTPKEAVLAWMTEAHALGSVDACVGSLDGAPNEAFPLVRLSQQMAASVRRTRKGQPKAEVQQAVRLAVRDAGFLYYLCTDLNFRILDQRQTRYLHIALLTVLLRQAIEHASVEELSRWRERARTVAHSGYVQQGILDTIGREYFEGQTPLFPTIAESVADQVSELGGVIEIYNEEVTDVGWRRKRQDPVFPQTLDLAQLRASAGPAIRAEMALVVDLAKAEAWNLIGAWRNGLEQLRPYVWPRGK